MSYSSVDRNMFSNSFQGKLERGLYPGGLLSDVFFGLQIDGLITGGGLLAVVTAFN